MSFNLKLFIGRAENIAEHDFLETVDIESLEERERDALNDIKGLLKDLGQSVGGHFSISAYGHLNNVPSPGDTLHIQLSAVPDPSGTPSPSTTTTPEQAAGTSGSDSETPVQTEAPVLDPGPGAVPSQSGPDLGPSAVPVESPVADVPAPTLSDNAQTQPAVPVADQVPDPAQAANGNPPVTNDVNAQQVAAAVSDPVALAATPGPVVSQPADDAPATDTSSDATDVTPADPAPVETDSTTVDADTPAPSSDPAPVDSPAPADAPVASDAAVSTSTPPTDAALTQESAAAPAESSDVVPDTTPAPAAADTWADPNSGQAPGQESSGS